MELAGDKVMEPCQLLAGDKFGALLIITQLDPERVLWCYNYKCLNEHTCRYHPYLHSELSSVILRDRLYKQTERILSEVILVIKLEPCQLSAGDKVL